MEYKDIEGYNGVYAVGRNGEVVSFKKSRPTFLKHNITEDGKHTVLLSNNGSTKRYSVAQLVAKAFVPNPDPERLKNVRQIDKSKNSLSADNLEWFSYNDVLNTPEAREKAIQGIKASFLHRDTSKEHENLRRSVCALNDKKEVLATFRSISDAEKMLNTRNIRQALKVGCRSAGYYWEYHEKES